MDYNQAGTMAPTPVAHMHPALQESGEPSAKRQRLEGEMPAPDGLDQHPVDVQPQVPLIKYSFSCRKVSRSASSANPCHLDNSVVAREAQSNHAMRFSLYGMASVWLLCVRSATIPELAAK